jgi:Ala-tRNA(Pro) deacylase
MTIAPTVTRFLHQANVPYDVKRHTVAASSRDTAEAAGVGADSLVKGVVVKDDARYAVVLLPAAMHVELGAVRRAFGHQCGLATEGEADRLFGDSANGAVPPIAQAYGLDVLVDCRALELDEVFLEGGDGRSLIAMTGAAFRSLMQDAVSGDFASAGPRPGAREQHAHGN